ncbi:hypothetical protein Pla175_22910 [Pirellulimonas nuda]|uniref:Glucose/Sorbosone dehydrogenase domain-containing protein n=1 Tax=Pirellulimonas nuda TaxID=2528009 RepID=A0A518DBP8_9BACT|nr:PQQ-dependent sugar dehydrogenase [Pirellulimonas nuda]QDU88907.1 hypothetical protein Pla175_22910 [Pirellulimonas nuda]
MALRRKPSRAVTEFGALSAVFSLLLGAASFGGPACAQAPDPSNSTKVLNLTTFATFSTISNSGAIDLQHSHDGSGRVFVSTNEGKIHAFSSTGASLGTFLDVAAPGVLPGFTHQGSFTTRGLTYMAFHPDYASRGASGEGKLYTITDVAPSSTANNTYTAVGLSTAPGSIISKYAITEWTVDASNSNQIDTSSRREVMRLEISGPSVNTHSVGQLSFNPFAKPGDADYGNLYIPLGDMHNQGQVPNWQHVQDADNPFGKILRINPLRDGDHAYSVPADNPLNDGGDFLDNDGNTEEIFAWGFRYPQNLSFARDANGDARLVVFDIGADDFEEVNLVDRGDNHGWTTYDGPAAGNASTTLHLPTGSTLEFPATVFDHEIPVTPGARPIGGNTAVTGGFVVSDPNDPDFKNQLVFGELARGAFFHADFDELVAADATDTQATMYLMNVSIDGGTPGAFRDLIDQPRGDQRFGVDESGRLYVFSKRTGEDIIYRTDLIANQNAYAGDYNDDGAVDLADYTVWRDNLGAPAGTLANDVDGGVIDVDHYNSWRTIYALSGSATPHFESAVVPEPASIVIAAGLLAVVAFAGRRRESPSSALQ